MAAESTAEEKIQAFNSFRSMPFDTAPYLAPPLVYGEWDGINVAFKTSPELVRKLLPSPLKPDATPWGSTEGDVLLITMCNYTLVKPRPVNYRATSLIIPATLNDKLGLYEARVYEDGEDPTMLTIWGREIWGFPKLAGKTDVVLDGKRASSTLRAFGGTSIDIALTLTGDKLVEPPMTWTLYCRKTIPSPDNPLRPDLDRLIEIPWRQSAETRLSGKVERCKVSLYLNGEIIQFPVKETVQAFWNSHREETLLDAGKVVHDYLR
jgi:acetoacetate decarboxylase